MSLSTYLSKPFTLPRRVFLIFCSIPACRSLHSSACYSFSSCLVLTFYLLFHRNFVFLGLIFSFFLSCALSSFFRSFPCLLISTCSLLSSSPFIHPFHFSLLDPFSTKLSFGTNVQPSTAQTQRLLKATHALQMPVIWKTNGVDVQSSDLLLVRSWIPQNDLLGHPKCRMFISHGGINGVLEAAYHGVPMAGFPMYADQFLNIATAEYRGMAKYIDKDTATDAELEATFRALLTDKT